VTVPFIDTVFWSCDKVADRLAVWVLEINMVSTSETVFSVCESYGAMGLRLRGYFRGMKIGTFQ
jgi:hypothetical protein